MHWLFCTHYYFCRIQWNTVLGYLSHWHKAFKFNCAWFRPELFKFKCSILQHVTIKYSYVWEPPTVKQVLPNQRSPQQLQCPLVCVLPSNKSIKKRTSNTLASVTAMLTSRQHRNSEATSSSTNSRLHQRSPVFIRPAALAIASTG
jgi:hypothetical protein